MSAGGAEKRKMKGEGSGGGGGGSGVAWVDGGGGRHERWSCIIEHTEWSF